MFATAAEHADSSVQRGADERLIMSLLTGENRAGSALLTSSLD
jgi:hypothetical protein